MKTVKGILFDLDQTLCNSEDYTLALDKTITSKEHYAEYHVYKFLKKYLKIVDWKTFKDEYFKARGEIHNELVNTAASHSRYLYIQRTLERFNYRFRPDLIYKATNIYWNFIIRNMKLFPNVRKVLRILKNNNIKIAVITDLTADIQIRKLKKLKISQYIDYLISSEEATLDKPSEKVAQLALNKMQLDSKEVVLIGNNPKTDIQLASRMNIKSILFDSSSYYKDKDHNADKYITNFKEILPILGIKYKNFSKEKLIIFDLIGTLTTRPHLVSDILSKIVPKNIDIIRKNYDLYRIDKIKRETFWKRLSITNIELIENELFDNIVLRKDAHNLLKKLRKKFKLAILSNIPKEWGRHILQKFNIEKYFDKIILSGEVKMKKPNPELYKTLLDNIKDLNHENIFYIDDDLGDLAASKYYLIKTIWLNIEKQKAKFIPDFVIKDISRIEQILEKV